MKNYKTISNLYRYYIMNEANKTTDGSSAWGEDIWYYKWCKVKGIPVLPMVNIKTKNFWLRFDPCDDEQYELYESICQQYGNPEWIQLS